MSKKKRLVIGVSGASGIPLAKRLLEELKKFDEIETHLILTNGAKVTIPMECDMTVEAFLALADVCYEPEDIGAAVASGSYDTLGMIVVPCSMKTLAGMAHGYTDNLLLRAADVCMKEQHRLLVVPRETPMSVIHLDNLAYLSKVPGVMILPPVVSYYHRPKTLEEMETQFVGKMLRVFGLEIDGYYHWRDET